MKGILPKTLLLTLLLAFTALQSDAQFFLNWDYFDLYTDTQESGAQPDFEIDALGNFHMVYWNRTSDKVVYGIRPVGASTWTFEDIDATKPNGFRCAMALDTAGTPHVAYFQDNSGEVDLIYAKRNGPGNWDIQSTTAPIRGWGEYGPDSQTITSDFLRPSLDIQIDPTNQEPKIALFNHYVDLGNVVACGGTSYFGDYEYQLYYVFHDGTDWRFHSFGEYPDYRTVGICVPLPHGDRYGEFATLTIDPNGKKRILCNTFFNNFILLFETLGNDSTWTGTPIDSCSGFQPELATPSWSWMDQYFTAEGESSFLSDDGTLHMAYTGSVTYGNNFFGFSAVLYDVAYHRRDSNGVYTLTTLFPSTAEVKPHMTNTSITATGIDTVAITFSDYTGGGYWSAISLDSGSTWDIDTLLYGITPTGRAPVRILGDTIYVSMHDGSHESLVLAKKAFSDTVWTMENVTFSELTAESISGQVLNRVADTLISFVYNDRYQGDLYYTEGIRTGGIIAWNSEQIDTDNQGYNSIVMNLNSLEEPCAVYSKGPENLLSFARKSGGSWSYEFIDTVCNALETSMVIGPGDTLHVAYYDQDSGSLYYAKKQQDDPNWMVQLVDSANGPTGSEPCIELAPDGSPRIAYYQLRDRQLFYAQPNGSNWTTDTLYYLQATSVGRFCSMVFQTNGQPLIAHTDHINNKLMLTERDSLGMWSTMTLDSGMVLNMGNPTELQIDQFGYPWIAYNTFLGSERIKMQKKSDTAWHEVNVSTQGFIGNSFTFNVAGDDLYILGRKNQTGDRGLAMIYAGNGLYVSIEEAEEFMPGISVLNFPNPFERETNFKLDLPEAEKVSLYIFDQQGKLVSTLAENRLLSKGEHRLNFNADMLSKGIYIYRVVVGEQVLGGKMILSN